MSTQCHWVENHKYLGTVFNNKLGLQPNVDIQRLCLLRRMNSFSMCTTLMALFYRSFLESDPSLCIAARFKSLRLANKSRLGVQCPVKLLGWVSCSSLTSSKRRSKGGTRSYWTVLTPQREFKLLPSGVDTEFLFTGHRYKVSFICTATKSLLLRRWSLHQSTLHILYSAGLCLHFKWACTCTVCPCHLSKLYCVCTDQCVFLQTYLQPRFDLAELNWTCRICAGALKLYKWQKICVREE